MLMGDITTDLYLKNNSIIAKEYNSGTNYLRKVLWIYS